VSQDQTGRARVCSSNVSISQDNLSFRLRRSISEWRGMNPFAVRMNPITVRVSVNVGIRYLKSFLGFIKPSPHRIPISSEIAPRLKQRLPAVVAQPALSAFPAAPSGPPNSIRKSPHPAAFAGVIGGDINRIRVSHGFSSFGGGFSGVVFFLG